MSKKITIPEVEIELGDNLFLRLKEVSYTPGAPEVRYYKDGSGSPEDPAEIDWTESKLVIRKIKYTTKDGGKSTKKEVNDYDFSIDDEFANEYYEQILEATEEILNEN